MKKVILALSVIGFMTACSSSTSEEVKTTDTVAAVVDTTAATAPVMDSTATVTTDTVTPVTK